MDILRRALPGRSTPSDIQAEALFLLGFFSAMRRSEIVALRVSDIDEEEEGLVIHIRRSKTDQRGRGAKVPIPYQSDPKLCPVRAYFRWKKTRSGGAGEDPESYVFRQIMRGQVISAKGVSSCWVARTIKRCCSMAGIDPKDIAGHSLRRGFATEASRKGKPLEAIKKHLRHTSIATTQRYLEEGKLFDEHGAAVGIT